MNCNSRALYVKKKYLTRGARSCILGKWLRIAGKVRARMGREAGSMDERLKQTLLYDFYGELLTEHQREVYEDVVLGDLGYSEAAEEYGVSRQGIHDLVKRVDRQLSEYEDKLALVERFGQIQHEVSRIRELARCSGYGPEEEAQITQICDRILSEL